MQRLTIGFHPKLLASVVILDDHVFEAAVHLINPVVSWWHSRSDYGQPIVSFKTRWSCLKIDFGAIW